MRTLGVGQRPQLTGRIDSEWTGRRNQPKVRSEDFVLTCATGSNFYAFYDILDILESVTYAS